MLYYTVQKMRENDFIEGFIEGYIEAKLESGLILCKNDISKTILKKATQKAKRAYKKHLLENQQRAKVNSDIIKFAGSLSNDESEKMFESLN